MFASKMSATYKPVALNCSCWRHIINILLTELSRSVWENLDLGRVYRPQSRFSHTDLALVALIVWWGSHPTGSQGDVGSNPAQGIKSFPSNENVIQKVVRPWSFLNSLQLTTFRRGLDCESIGDPSWGQRCTVGFVTDLYYIYMYFGRILAAFYFFFQSSCAVDVCFLAVSVVDIHIRSEGCEDQGMTDTCGIAYIKVNGHDHSMHGRGHNVVVVDATTGNVTTNCTMFPYFVIFYFQSSLFLQHSTALHREKK